MSLLSLLKQTRVNRLIVPLTRTLAKDVAPFNDIETHTGQKFEKDDYRPVRFVDKEKHVNTQFAIDLIAEVPPKPCKERVVWCDGGSGPTGHPKVYINLVSYSMSMNIQPRC
ncbi:NADH dehydrogenase [ubiquinone] iron-sulfur protein 6, mitochondrial-like [Diaphorina citri]|uniref:NADH dehydrogenase [ubiquinone] iron-sulfur protein 6, mitochondrial-like n=1 Tax=Diaphorina citri TaxID=121845 RepID=A0A1S3D0J9_DIACI|nr:NADH dehydrogenase [ubiquinone] iron-sulfur protein 6, mitochondrial-like [Diaphorina citri]XP_008470842.1 NADH dehydrogenase [ubiquinone] iron-sulfur protein 6, mitochondrial-like [Diaphorina citri]